MRTSPINIVACSPENSFKAGEGSAAKVCDGSLFKHLTYFCRMYHLYIHPILLHILGGVIKYRLASGVAV